MKTTRKSDSQIMQILSQARNKRGRYETPPNKLDTSLLIIKYFFKIIW